MARARLLKRQGRDQARNQVGDDTPLATTADPGASPFILLCSERIPKTVSFVSRDFFEKCIF